MILLSIETSAWENKAHSVLKKFDKQIQPGWEFLIHQYDHNDVEIGVLEAPDLFIQPNYQDFYYRLDPFLETPRGKIPTIHFGVSVSNEGSNEFDLGIYLNQYINYLISIGDDFHGNSDALIKTINSNLGFHCEDLSIIAKLDHREFDDELSRFLSKALVFSEISDIREVSKRPGLYLLVLDGYASCYIGQAKNIRLRIQQHWRKTHFGTTGIDTCLRNVVLPLPERSSLRDRTALCPPRNWLGYG